MKDQILDMSSKILTGHRRLNVRHISEVITSHRKLNVRHEKGSLNKSRKI